MRHPDWSAASWIEADWPAPAGVRAGTSTRIGGFSQESWAGLNLGDHVGDDRRAVAQNRDLLRVGLGLESAPVWLRQVHGTRVVELPLQGLAVEADGAWTRQAGTVCAVLTADCLPILLAATDGACVAAIHAGWRGLCGGVVEAGIAAMPSAPAMIQAWIGPAIGAASYEVGAEVRAAFVDDDPATRAFFRPSPARRWLADLAAIARHRLLDAGLAGVYGGDLSTYSDAVRFYSYRRDPVSGRQASLIWMESH